MAKRSTLTAEQLAFVKGINELARQLKAAGVRELILTSRRAGFLYAGLRTEVTDQRGKVIEQGYTLALNRNCCESTSHGPYYTDHNAVQVHEILSEALPSRFDAVYAGVKGKECFADGSTLEVYALWGKSQTLEHNDPLPDVAAAVRRIAASIPVLENKASKRQWDELKIKVKKIERHPLLSVPRRIALQIV